MLVHDYKNRCTEYSGSGVHLGHQPLFHGAEPSHGHLAARPLVLLMRQLPRLLAFSRGDRRCDHDVGCLFRTIHPFWLHQRYPLREFLLQSESPLLMMLSKKQQKQQQRGWRRRLPRGCIVLRCQHLLSLLYCYGQEQQQQQRLYDECRRRCCCLSSTEDADGIPRPALAARMKIGFRGRYHRRHPWLPSLVSMHHTGSHTHRPEVRTEHHNTSRQADSRRNSLGVSAKLSSCAARRRGGGEYGGGCIALAGKSSILCLRVSVCCVLQKPSNKNETEAGGNRQRGGVRFSSGA